MTLSSSLSFPGHDKKGKHPVNGQKWVGVSIRMERERKSTTNPRPTIVKGYVHPEQAQFSSVSLYLVGSRGNRGDVVSNVAFRFLRMDFDCNGGRPFLSVEHYDGVETDHYTNYLSSHPCAEEENRGG